MVATCLLAAALAGPGDVNPFFALNGTKAFHIPEQLAGTAQRRADLMREAGVRWDRSDLWWHVVEPERGRFDWSRPDAVFEFAERNGLQWYPILCYGAAWFEQGRNTPRSDQDYEDFVRYVEATVGRYKGRAPAWSLWNEPNILPFWAPEPNVADYVRLMKLAYPALKRADPGAKLAAPAVAPLGPWDRGFVERMYKLGGGPFFDIFDYHYYRSDPPEGEVPRELNEIKAVMRRFDREKPIWISESGVTSVPLGVPAPEERQAALVVRNHLLALGMGVERFFYFDLQNWWDDRPEVWDGQLGLVKADFTPKASWKAYKTMVQQVGGDEPIGLLDGLPDGVWGLLTRRGTVYKLALWTEGLGNVATLPIRAGGRNMTIRDWQGKARRVLGRTGAEVRVQVGQHPLFITGVDPNVYLPMAGVKLEEELVILAQGETATPSLRVDAGLGASSAWVSQVRAPSGLEFREGRLTVLPEAKPGTYTLPVRVSLRRGDEPPQALEREWIVEVVEATNAALTVRMDRAEPHVSIQLGNNLRQGHKVSYSFAGHSSEVDLPPFGLVRRDQPFEALRAVTEPREWLLQVGDARPVGLMSAPVPFLSSAPQIDGDLADWASVEPLSQGQFAGRTTATDRPEIRVALDGHHLYVSISTEDETPFNPESAGAMWRADSLELYLGLDGPTDRRVLNKAREFQLGFAPQHEGDKGPVVFWFHEDVVLESARVAVGRRAGGWTLEAAVPWSALRLTSGLPQVGTVLGLDWKLTDTDAGDSTGPARDTIWNGDGTSWINPSVWGVGVVGGG